MNHYQLQLSLTKRQHLGEWDPEDIASGGRTLHGTLAEFVAVVGPEMAKKIVVVI